MKANIAVTVAALLVLLAVLLLIYNDTNAFVKPTARTSAVLPTPTNIALTDQLVDPTGKAIPCVYINLDRSTDRRERFTQRAKVHNLECTRIPGVDGKDPEAVKIITRNDFAKTMSPSEVGCTASHLKTIKHAFELNLDYALVLEDDTTFDFVNYWPKDVIKNLLTDIPEYVGVVQLFWTQHRRKYARFVAPTHVARGVDSRMASAYIVTKRGMTDILSVADNKDGTFGIVKQYDHQKEGVADKYIYDLTRLCTSGLPLLCVDINDLPSTIENIAYMGAKHPSYRDVADANQAYAKLTIEYKQYWPGTAYRMGDTVLGSFKPDLDKAYHLDMYPNSLTALYFDKTDKLKDLDVLTQCTKAFRDMHNIPIPRDTDVVLHLRLGDVIERSEYSVEEHLLRECPSLGNYFYVKPYSYFDEEFRSIDTTNQIIIMYGSAFPEFGFAKSEAYVKRITQYLGQKGYKTFVRKGKGADDDFVFGAHANRIVTTGGGYSKLLSEVQTRIQMSNKINGKNTTPP
jgi:hypothetical protein